MNNQEDFRWQIILMAELYWLRDNLSIVLEVVL